ncbi:MULTISPECIES: ATP-binding protein [Acidobacterium]|nr:MULTISPECIES: ATP-binding protein [Acidobacterium]
MDSATFRRHLLRLCWVPVLALFLLCLLLGYELDRITMAAQWVDHSDRVIAQMNQVSRAIADRQSVLRAYLLTQQPHYLHAYIRDQAAIRAGFDDLRQLVADNREQIAAVDQWSRDYQAWSDLDPRSVAQDDRSSLLAYLQSQKIAMHQALQDRETMMRRELELRERRTVVLERLDWMSVLAFFILAIGVGALIVWRTTRTFHLVHTGYDQRVNEAKSLYEETLARRQWLDTTLRSIGDAVIACDAEGRIAFMNPVAEQLTGWNEAEARGLDLSAIFRIVNENTQLAVENPVEKVRRQGTIVGLANHTLLIRKDGAQIPIDDSAAPIRNSDSNLIGVVLVFRDITAKKETERALLRAEKLASAGRLSASIAHEINNPLEALMNLLYLTRHMDNLTEVHEYLAQAESQLRRISHIARQSLGFYRDSTVRSTFSMRGVIGQAVEFYAARAAMQGVRMEVAAASDVYVFGSADEIMQVLSNLLANSLDAMPGSGIIRIHLRQTTASPDGRADGVRLYVSDNGNGIHPEQRQQIFDPFFTTKGTTSTGLGLWVTQQLIEKHGGSVAVRSRTQGTWRGTFFRIYLPQTPGTGSDRKPNHAILEPAPDESGPRS